MAPGPVRAEGRTTNTWQGAWPDSALGSEGKAPNKFLDYGTSPAWPDGHLAASRFRFELPMDSEEQKPANTSPIRQQARHQTKQSLVITAI